MQITMQIIPLRLTSHSDRTSILTAYSRENGTMGFAVPAGSGVGARRRRALLMPLNPLEVVATLRPGSDLATFREPRPLMALHTILGDPLRTSTVMFLAEALLAILRQSDADSHVFDFIVDAVERLNDPLTPTGNFHLTFLTRLAAILGIAPDAGNYRSGMVFDMADGCFRQSAALHGHTLSPSESAAVERLSRITWANMGAFKFTRAERAAVLDRIMEYYTLHLANLSSLKSPAILRTLLQ